MNHIHKIIYIILSSLPVKKNRLDPKTPFQSLLFLNGSWLGTLHKFFGSNQKYNHNQAVEKLDGIY